ncbi:sigma-70 family RNA polymerase sigma factor [Chitinivorax sp. B]|uniref:sigma-70 family RNA polymerase sigma factor n=1 Tax=Chitinivorax sp. B TaxID=2502235 RepID=UPI0010F83E4B|nr:sigma-70 family RNA polymerase sigma factor [Chitinivorax sp. B]
MIDPGMLSSLLLQSARGDQQAFSALYRHTSAKLFAVALRILQRRDWAEEVLQDCYVKIWQHAGEYGADKSQPMTWMTSIVRNRCIDWLRRPREEHLPENEDGEQWIDLEDESDGPLQLLAQNQDTAWLARCMEKLTPRERQSISLAFYHGLSHSELADHLREPLGSVKTWVRRGLERLKGCLAI